MKQIILNNWNFMRVLRLALGLFILVQGALMKDWTLVALGGLFSLTPLFNIGCCGVGGCSTPVQRNNIREREDITFEEVK